MNKKVYLGIYAGSFGLAILLGAITLILALAADNMPNARREIQNIMAPIAILSAIIGVVFLFVYVVYFYLILAKMWGAIQDGYARTTVGKAIGFLFIPFFNIYWIFNVWGGFPTDYNNFIQRNGIQTAPLSPVLYILFPICVLLSSVTFGVSLLINFVVLFLITSKTCDIVNTLDAIKQQRQFNQPPPQQNYGQMPPQNYMQ